MNSKLSREDRDLKYFGNMDSEMKVNSRENREFEVNSRKRQWIPDEDSEFYFKLGNLK